jgi:hypothetical protein
VIIFASSHAGIGVEWIPLAGVRQMIAKGEIVSGPTFIGLPMVTP